MASANVKITIVGGSQALKDLAGIEKGAQKAATAEMKAARDAEKAAKKAADAQAREAMRAAREAEKAAKFASSAKTREAEKAAKDAQKISDRAAQSAARADAKLIAQHEAYQRKLTDIAARGAAQRSKDEEKSINARRKAASDTLRRAGGVIGALGAGAVAGGVTAMSTARSVAGVQDVGTRVQNANALRERLIITSGAGGMDTNALQGKLTDAAMASGKSPTGLMDVLASGQSQFNNLKFFADNLKTIAVTAKATGAEEGDVGQALGFAQQALSIKAEDSAEALNLMVAAAEAGSIEMSSFSKDFAANMGIFAETTNMKGLEGLREFLGMAQGIGTLGAGSSESATMQKRMLALMQDPETVEKLRPLGINPQGMSPTNFIDALGSSEKFAKPGVQEKLFGGNVEANLAITALMSARQRKLDGVTGAIDMKSIANVDSKIGADTVQRNMAKLEAEGLLDLQRKAIEMEVDTITHLKDYNEQIMMVTEVSNRLEKSFGTLSLWASSIGVGGAVSTVGSVVSMVSGAKTAADAASVAGTAVGAGGLMATLGAPVGALAAGGAAGIATLLGGAVAAGLAGYFGAKALGADSAGEWLGNTIADLLGTSDVDGIERETKVALTTDVTIHDNRTEVKQSSKSQGASSVHTGRGPMRLDSGM